MRPQRAGVVGELGRQHRRDEARHVRRERPLGSTLVERASGGHEVRDVRDVHPRADPVGLAAERERVVEVLRRVRVDREASSARGGRRAPPGRLALREGVAARTRPARRFSTSSASSTFSIRFALPEPALDLRTPAPGANDGEVAGADVVVAPLRVDEDGHAGGEVRLAVDQLAAAADLDDEEVRAAGGRGWRRGRQTFRKRRRVSPEPIAPRPRPDPEQDQRRHRERERLHVGVARERVVHDRRQRDLLAEEQEEDRQQRPGEPAEQALDHERTADEPVRRADELHHLDLTPPREDREPDRVRDQQRRGDQQHDRGDDEHQLDPVRDLEDPVRDASCRSRPSRRRPAADAGSPPRPGCTRPSSASPRASPGAGCTGGSSSAPGSASSSA